MHAVFSLLKWLFHNSEKSAFVPFLSGILTVAYQWGVVPCNPTTVHEIHVDFPQEQGNSNFHWTFSSLWLLDIDLGLLMIMQLCLSFEVNYHFSTEPFEMWQYLICEPIPQLPPISRSPLMMVHFCFEMFGTCFKRKFHSLIKIILFKNTRILSRSKERSQIGSAKNDPGTFYLSKPES